MSDLWDGNYYKKHAVLQKAAALSLLNTFSFKESERVLDIGCGPGTISNWIADRVPKGKVVGIDPSMGMLGEAISDYKAVPNLKFFCKKVENFQFDEKFDVVTSFHALHFVKDHQRAFEQIKSALVPGGRILIHLGSSLQPTLSEVFEREPWKSTFSKLLKEKFFPMTADQANTLLDQFGFIATHVKVQTDDYVFPSPEDLVNWLMGWLRNSSELPQERNLELAKEITELSCLQANSRRNILVQYYPVVIKAHLPK